MPLTAIYDGHCVICNTTKTIIGALDWFNRIEFLNLHDHAEVERRFPEFDHQTLMGEIHVVDGQNRVYGGFAATRRMLRATPLGLPVWAIFRLPIIGDWLGPKAYRFIARHRYRINRFFGVDLDQRDQECSDGVCKIPQ